MKTSHGRRRLTLGATLAVGALALGACGGGDDSDAGQPEPLTLGGVTECFEGAGQKVREVEVSFAKIPPDVDVSSRAGSADVWVADDAAGVEAVVTQAEELNELGGTPELTPVEDQVVRSGNAVAIISTDASPDYRTTVEECLPPS